MKYVAKTDFVVNVKFSLIENDEKKEDSPPSASNIKMEINLLLDDTVLPEIDDFLKEAVPLAVNFDESRGDTLAIIRKTFPERSSDSITLNKERLLKIIELKFLTHFKPETMFQAWNGQKKV